jgi:ribosome-binding ATPase
MSLKCGIVGLPNVGKSTLFNALGSAKAEAANYPFCTIEPNVGVVSVPDSRLEAIAKLMPTEKVIRATTEIVDIAGIVKGASKGEGLGNQFLHHIREVDAIIHLVRCFINDDIIHVDGAVDPARDIEVINTELLLADLQTLDKKLDRERRAARTGDKDAKKSAEILEGLKLHMDQGNPARSFKVDLADKPILTTLMLLTLKPMLYVANSGATPQEQPFLKVVESIATKENARYLIIDCSLESEIAQLPEGERAEYLAGLGLEESGLSRLIRSAFDLLGLMTYYTAGVKEARAWTIHKGTKAPQAAGVIHTDLEKAFIRAECYKSEDLIRLGSEAKIKEAGLLRVEGKDYEVQPDDVLYFRTSA